MARVAVLDDWQGIAEKLADWSVLRARAEVVFFRNAIATPDDLVQRLAGFDIVLAMRERTQFPAAVLQRLGELRLLSFTGARNAAIDTAAATAKGILVCNTAGRSSHATAELALGLLLACARRIPLGDARIRTGFFQDGVPPGLELAGRTLGLVGLGHIGGRVARYGKALDMQVIAWSQNLTEARAQELGVTRVGKDELFARADAISIHLVLSPRTRGVVGAREIAAMKRGAILVNTSRGPLVDQDALLAALDGGRILAGLDVYDIEPLPPAHPLRIVPNAVLTPHLGYVTETNMAAFYRASIENVLAFLDGAPIRVVNPELLAEDA
ncbi:D-3-phosphoglycerate dehydrogenase [Rhodovastum atsumiense]|uniref:D-2-hydroxyacid dehydrogenase family protein n=1 Tax=Rhodovastum atsumiense TaxID=504468 RepID=A0A5M6INY6_9PROT|nr:D-2-hydroxyacid dehydrogenase family protein [Rhodovastum atsumiense]CAH2598600.1 D-3-phosphoglycerate dehydrogenase [Rhodovastum atsumiense]